MRTIERRGFMYWEDGPILAGVAAALAEHRAAKRTEPNVVWVHADALEAPVAVLGVPLAPRLHAVQTTGWVRGDELVQPGHYLVGVE